MWRTIHKEITGSSHVKHGLPCQDKTSVLQTGGVCVISLADGAGSASHSDAGAALTVQYTSKYLAAHFDELYGESSAAVVKTEFLQGLQADLAKCAEEMRVEVHALASTLLAVAVKDERFLAFHVGDGVIGGCRNGEMVVLSHPQNGEFANETAFITSKNAIRDLRVYKGALEQISAFILMSDGTAHSFYNTRDYPKQLHPLLGRMPEYLAFLNMSSADREFGAALEQFAQATDDDCSFALMCTSQMAAKAFSALSHTQVCALLEIDPAQTKRIVRSIQTGGSHILSGDQERCSVAYLARIIGCRRRDVRKRLAKLIPVLNICYDCTCSSYYVEDYGCS